MFGFEGRPKGSVKTSGAYSFVRTRQPSPGATRYGFERPSTLPLFAAPGPGTPVPQFWDPVQPEQLYFVMSAVMQGKIGIQAGTIALQPLVNDGSMNQGAVDILPLPNGGFAVMQPNPGLQLANEGVSMSGVTG